MQGPTRFFLLLSLLLFVACGEDQPPTAPVSPTENTTSAASHLVVNSLADPGDGTCNARECTLREAIENAGSTTISFASGLTGTITLARPAAGGGTLVINKALTITGPSGRITIARRSTDPAFRLLTIGDGGIASLANLSLRNGRTDRNGGGIINFGSLTLRNCIIADNRAFTGGGIDNHGPLTLTRTVVEHNARSSTFGVGGIHNHLRRVSITNSSVANNSGEGIFNGGGSLEIANSTISDNSGGGVGQDWGGTTLDHVKILSNSGGGISNHQGGVFLTNSTVARNSSSRGGGIFNSAGGFISIVSSTISNNSATERGGGIFSTVHDSFGRLSAGIEIFNSTVSGNSAQFGGGIENSNDLGGADVRIINSTIARNSALSEGGGVRNEDSEVDSDQSNSVFLINSLVALNSAPTAPDAADVGARFSLIGDGTGSGVANTNGNKVGKVSPNSSRIDPRIGALANNGGPTRTHALLAGSPALNAASSSDCPAKDQRGVARPQGAGCDMGSFEKN
jgi:CSLREA domain-containing protein